MPVPEIASLPNNPNFLHAVRALAVDAVSAEVIAAFRTAGIPSILLKGRSIARWLYPRGGRSYGDTDVLVREGDVAAAEAVLRRLGFVDIADEWASAEHMPHEIARTFVRPLAPERPPERGHGGNVDLHWSIHHVPVAPDVVWKTFNAHTTTLLLGGVETTALDTTALALHVVLHAAQHAKEKHTGEDLRRAVRALSVEEWAESPLWPPGSASRTCWPWGCGWTGPGKRWRRPSACPIPCGGGVGRLDGLRAAGRQLSGHAGRRARARCQGAGGAMGPVPQPWPGAL